jgi:hypothetical protein
VWLVEQGPGRRAGVGMRGGAGVDGSPRPEPPSLLQSPSPSTLRHRPPLPPSWPPSWSQPTLASAIGQQKSHRQLHQQCHKRITAISPVAPSRPIPPSPLHVSPAVFFRPPPPPRSGERRLKPERGWREGDWGGRTRRIPCGPRPTLNSRCSASARRPHRIVSILGGG